mmetsp:Transcript_19777/g.40695  ORF Transcript_19777/g.40695 Transcript_19777/m.40695 type:complete len:595 (+) Transcript_19777:221-2005(+)
MLSPLSKRIVSPSKISSPRGNNHGRNYSRADILGAVFLRYSKWLLVGIIGIAVTRIATLSTTTIIPTHNPGSTDFWDADDNAPDITTNVLSSNTFPLHLESQSSSDYNYIDRRHQSPKHEKVENIEGVDEVKPTTTITTIATPTATATPSQSENHGDLLSQYNPSNAPVILDGWNRTVQVHLIVDVTGSLDINPASKLLLAAVERSKYTQLVALTFARPSVETLDMFSRKPELPLLYLVDWGSMDRDCHRLELVLENIRQQQRLSSAIREETEEPYFLLVDSSGSSRRTGCSYLFRSNGDDGSGGETTFSYGRTNDMTRIRLSKRSIVQNRYYDRASNTIHLGEVSPNQWDDVPSDYDRTILYSPFSLRESFVMSIQNITNGYPVSMNDSKRTVDVGFFWKSGDYSHYGLYRRDIAKVIKTLHHSSVDKAAGTLMENAVQISYTDEKGMEAGSVQFKYTMELLSCKIVVIAQRDEWEDHYRLMESLASGALVMTDRMIALPAGLKDKVNIVIYDNRKMLKDLVKYYLKAENKHKRKRIASQGYKLVMGRHRSWHRLEALLFGRPLTNVDQPNAPAPEKEVSPGLSATKINPKKL